MDLQVGDLMKLESGGPDILFLKPGKALSVRGLHAFCKNLAPFCLQHLKKSKITEREGFI